MKDKNVVSAQAPRDREELHDIFFTYAIATAIVGFVFVWLAQNAVNHEGIVTFKLFFLKKPFEVTPFLFGIFLNVIAVIGGVVDLIYRAVTRNSAIGSSTIGYAFSLIVGIVFMISRLIVSYEMSTFLCSIFAGVLGLSSIGCGLARNHFKRENKIVSYLCGIVVVVLAAIAFMAGVYAE